MGSSRAAIENLDLEFAQRDIADVSLFEEETPAVAADAIGSIDIDPELVGYDPFF